MMPYAWTTDEDVVDLNAVTVAIGAAEQENEQWVDVGATVMWPEQKGLDDVSQGGAESFEDVCAALKRAEEIRGEFGFPRLVISIEDRNMWKPEWGALADIEGY
jgi:hypothetical protein